MTEPLSVVLLEPWFDGSHRAWAEGYRRHSRHHVELITLPGRFWRWRMRGASATFAAALAGHVHRHGVPDVLLVSSPVDVAALVGLARRLLSDTAVVLYLHENQIAYPHGDGQDLDAAFRTWTSLVAADVVLLNSQHHRSVLSEALPALLETAPDESHSSLLPGVLDRLEVVPVGVELTDIVPVAPVDGPPVVLWSHRWDDDKNPAAFVRTLTGLADRGVDFRVILCGDDAWDGEPRRQQAVERLGHRVLASGFVDREHYLRNVQLADVVVSVAAHEFFGVAMVEAMAAGCVPLLPDHLSYPELVPEAYRAAALYRPGTFGTRLQAVLTDIDEARARVAGLATAMQRFGWQSVAPVLDARLTDAASAVRSSS